MATSIEQSIIAHLPSTRRYARALIGDSELANEAVMHAITGLMNVRLPWIPEKLIRLWLAHLVNVYVDQRLDQPHDNDQDVGRDEAVAASPGMAAANDVSKSSLLIDRVDAMLQDLTEQQRRIYLLIALESFTSKNVALLLQMTPDSVQSEYESIKTKLSVSIQSATVKVPRAA